MCGIAACVSINNNIDHARFESMTDIVAYRGPDDRGTYYDDRVALGHRRLAIIDLSPDGHQPFELVEGYVLIFNGEIYNYIELRKELIADGYVFASQTDTEVIIHAYRKWGSECVNHFNGMWAFVLYDKSANRMFCSRDRFGVKPLYYTQQEGLFLMASEIKQLFEMLDEKPCADNERLMRYIVRGDTDTPPYTLFRNIFQLEPGSNLFYDLDSFSYDSKRYYVLDKTEDYNISYEEACERFKSSFVDGVRVRLRSDVPVGYFLSGGLDSSSIVCTADMLRRESAKTGMGYEQHTISSCYEDKRYDEQEYVDAVAEVTDVTVHKVFPDRDNIWGTIDRILWHMDEPLFGLSALSQWNVCKAAGENGLKVILDGQGSDEQLAGYNDFYTVLFIHLIKKGNFKYLKREVDSYIKLHRGDGNVYSRRRILVSAIKDSLTPQILDRFVKRLYYIYAAGIPFSHKQLRKLFKDIKVYPRRNPRAFIGSYMTDELLYILHNLDRKTMAFSVEARDPFLDYRLVEDIYSMPFTYKIRDGWTKAVLRDGMAGIIPDKIKTRKTKLAFVAPVEKWINEDKALYGEKLEKSLQKLSGLFDEKRIIKWYNKKSYLCAADCNLVWRIIIVGRWIEMFNIVMPEDNIA